MTSYTDFRVEQDKAGCAWVFFDKQDSQVNTFTVENLKAFSRLIQDLSKAKIKSMVFQSAKSSGFIAGADIHLFMQDPSQVETLLNLGQTVFHQLEAAPFYSLSVIDGFCLGGGLECALAFKHRIAIDDPRTRIGLPEIGLGVVPGWGGSVRLSRQIGHLPAIQHILQAKPVSAKVAHQVGIVEVLLKKRHLDEAIRVLLEQKPKPKPKRLDTLLWSNALYRAAMVWLIERKVQRKVVEAHYPAPFVFLRQVRDCQPSSSKGFTAELRSFKTCIQNPSTHNLVRCFFLREKCKPLKGEGKVMPLAGLRVSVIGAGRMGRDIASAFALKGAIVRLQDENKAVLASALQACRTYLQQRLADNPVQKQNAIDNLAISLGHQSIGMADLVIEAIVESVPDKKKLLTALQAHLKPGAILASNTSTIPIEVLAEGMKDPTRFIGMHFFNPVAKMPLVEVVRGKQTDEAVVRQVTHWVKDLGKLPLCVKSAKGFVVNRVLVAYLTEALLLHEEGFSISDVDKQVVSHGFPMGPFTLMDTVGLDVCADVVKQIMPELNLPLAFKHLLETGALGQKTQRGFYAYRGGERVMPKTTQTELPDWVMDRLWVRLWIAAEGVLRDKIVNSADELDAALLFGAGFPPFLGGLLHYIRAHEKTFHAVQQNLATRYGARFCFPKAN